MINPKLLPLKSQKVFYILANLPIWNDFYIGGGSGLILRFGHRISTDFDLFSSTNRLASPERRVIHQLLKKSGKTIVESTREGSFRVTFEGVTIGFFHYDYPLMKPLEKFDKVKIASLEDIALMKIAAIIGRGSKKDFIDTYFILNPVRNHLKVINKTSRKTAGAKTLEISNGVKNNIGLAKLLKLSLKKFSHVRDVSIQTLQALVYFDDAEDEPMPRISYPIKWETVKSFFIKEITKFSKKTLGI